MKYHETANIFPLMEGKEFDALVRDIETKGQQEPITTLDGKILDGRNRYRACVELNIPPICRSYDGKLSPHQFVLSRNLHRRHLSKSQWAAIAVDIQENLAEEIAEEKREKNRLLALKRESEKRGEQLDPEIEKQVSVLLPKPARDAREETVQLLAGRTSGKPISDAKNIKEEAPDLFDDVVKGETTLSQAKRELKDRNFVPPDPIEGMYRVWYADSPWDYGNKGIINDDNYGRAERHYPTMSIEQLCDMGDEIKAHCEKDAVLFMWVTSPMLDVSFQVIEGWGFKYKSSFIWNKVRHNFAHYNSMRHEFLLICTRGSCTPDIKELEPSIITEERNTIHSRKPERFRDIIDMLYTQGNRIEMFARFDDEEINQRRKERGWETWENEVNTPITRDS